MVQVPLNALHKVVDLLESRVAENGAKDQIVVRGSWLKLRDRWGGT